MKQFSLGVALLLVLFTQIAAGTRTKESFFTEIVSNITSLDRAYQEFAASEGCEGGHLTVHWRVSSDGSVESCSLIASTVSSESFETRALEMMQDWNFGYIDSSLISAEFVTPLDFTPREREKMSIFVEANLKSTMLFFAIGGLAIFLLGMNYMSSGLQTIAGPKLRGLISSITNNRFAALLTGVTVTTIVQSSSITTVMVVGLVNSGVMTLKQSLGVIFGANIGTTITGWVIALQVGRYGLPILAVSAFVYIFSKKDRLRYTAMAFLGIGMVFFGLELMRNGFASVSNNPAFSEFFLLFKADSYGGLLLCVLTGAVLTALVQSSSATLGITITLGVTGAIPYETAAAFVLGENIGTTFTAFLASLTGSDSAKRAAYGHVIFNIIGVLWITSIFGFYVNLVETVYVNFSDVFSSIFGQRQGGQHDLGIKIAMVHTGFNVTNSIIFLPLLNHLSRLLYKILPERSEVDTKRITRLQPVSIHDTPAFAIEEVKHELVQMSELVSNMLKQVYDVISEKDFNNSEKIALIFQQEDDLDRYQSEISVFLMDILGSKVISHDDSQIIQSLFRLADEYEDVSDYLTKILKCALKLRDEEVYFDKEEQRDILHIHGKITEYITLLNNQIKSGDLYKPSASTIIVPGDDIKVFCKKMRKEHLARLSNHSEIPFLSVTYLDVITFYRRTNDHLQNIAETLCHN